jgi:hypothetical protein
MEVQSETKMKRGGSKKKKMELETMQMEDIEIKMESVVSATGELIDPLKKRRGRKPKSKEVEDLEERDNDESVVEEEENKKRGRKPKEKTYSISTGGVVESEEKSSETVILHLPIKKEGEEKVDPSPYIKKNINYSMISTYSVSELFDPIPSTAYQFTTIGNKKRDETIVSMMNDGEKVEEKTESGVKNDYDANFSFLESEGKEEEEVEDVSYEGDLDE